MREQSPNDSGLAKSNRGIEGARHTTAATYARSEEFVSALANGEECARHDKTSGTVPHSEKHVPRSIQLILSLCFFVYLCKEIGVGCFS